MNAPLPWKDIAKIGGFTTTEVGRLIGRPSSNVASWLGGNPPLIQSDYEPLNGRLLLSFEGLIEARAISFFLEEGLSKKSLRRIQSELRKRTGERHPLAMDGAFVTDGFRLFEREADKLINMANNVYAEPTLMKPALHGRVIFDQGRALYLQPEPYQFPEVRIDPKHAFGRPIVVSNGRAVTTSALAGAVEAEGLILASEWFGVSESAAQQAVDYEKLLAA